MLWIPWLFAVLFASLAIRDYLRGEGAPEVHAWAAAACIMVALASNVLWRYVERLMEVLK